MHKVQFFDKNLKVELFLNNENIKGNIILFVRYENNNDSV